MTLAALEDGPSIENPVIENAGIGDVGIVTAGMENAGIGDVGIVTAGIADGGIENAGIENAGIVTAGIGEVGIEYVSEEDADILDVVIGDTVIGDTVIGDTAIVGAVVVEMSPRLWARTACPIVRVAATTVTKIAFIESRSSVTWSRLITNNPPLIVVQVRELKLLSSCKAVCERGRTVRSWRAHKRSSRTIRRRPPLGRGS